MDRKCGLCLKLDDIDNLKRNDQQAIAFRYTHQECEDEAMAWLESFANHPMYNEARGIK